MHMLQFCISVKGGFWSQCGIASTAAHLVAGTPEQAAGIHDKDMAEHIRSARTCGLIAGAILATPALLHTWAQAHKSRQQQALLKAWLITSALLAPVLSSQVPSWLLVLPQQQHTWEQAHQSRQQQAATVKACCLLLVLLWLRCLAL
jgi:hypothetical protein